MITLFQYHLLPHPQPPALLLLPMQILGNLFAPCTLTFDSWLTQENACVCVCMCVFLSKQEVTLDMFLEVLLLQFLVNFNLIVWKVAAKHVT